MAKNPPAHDEDEALLDEGDGRQRSTIGFPYADLGDAVELAEAIHGNVGSASCEDEQLAAWLGLSAKSSGYRVRVAAARMFGLISSPESGVYALTELGKKVVDPQRARGGKADAFLQVPLFRKVYEDHKGGSIPPPAAIERVIETAGVAPKQKGRARQVLERSAEQAGFFEHGRDRLVKPGVKEDTKTPRTEDKKPSGGGGDGEGGELHPFILGLLKTLPTPGSNWPETERVKWLSTASQIFGLIYKGDPFIADDDTKT